MSLVAVYVMTRNLARLYRPEAPAADPTRFDMPAEHYRLTIGGMRGKGCKVTMYDPLDDRRPEVRVLRRDDEGLVVDVPLTDSPRLLSLEEPP